METFSIELAKKTQNHTSIGSFNDEVRSKAKLKLAITIND
jgi:hypothetical protein